MGARAGCPRLRRGLVGGRDTLAKKPAKHAVDDSKCATDRAGELREAYKRIEAEPPPQRLLAAFERLFGGRKADPRN